MPRRVFRPEHLGAQGHSGRGSHPQISIMRGTLAPRQGEGQVGEQSTCGSLCPHLLSPPGRSFQPACHRDPHCALHGHPVELCSSPKSEVRVLLLCHLVPGSISGCAKFPWIADPVSWPPLQATTPAPLDTAEAVEGVIKIPPGNS